MGCSGVCSVFVIRNKLPADVLFLSLGEYWGGRDIKGSGWGPESDSQLITEIL